MSAPTAIIAKLDGYQRSIMVGYARALAAGDMETVRESCALQRLLDELRATVLAGERSIARSVFTEFMVLAECMNVAAATRRAADS